MDMWEAMTGYLQLLEQHQEQQQKPAHSGGGAQDSAASGSTKDPLATRIKCAPVLPPSPARRPRPYGLVSPLLVALS
mgnify:CR=1 FL=1